MLFTFGMRISQSIHSQFFSQLLLLITGKIVVIISSVSTGGFLFFEDFIPNLKSSTLGLPCLLDFEHLYDRARVVSSINHLKIRGQPWTALFTI